MARINRTTTPKAKAKAIALKENSSAMATHALLIAATLLGTILALTSLV